MDSKPPPDREAITAALVSIRDERAIPLFSHIVRTRDYRRTLRTVYETAIEALGALGGPESVEALKTALYDGEWWAPFRTSAIRSMVAEALGETRTPEALTVLQDAAAMGGRGVRSAARHQIARGVAPARGAREQQSKEPSA